MSDAVYLLILGALLAALLAHAFRLAARLKKTEAEARVLRVASEHSPTSIVVTRPDTTIQYVNAFFTRVSGYSAEEAIGKTPKILASA